MKREPSSLCFLTWALRLSSDTESATWAIYHWLDFNFIVGSSLERLEADTLLYLKQMKDLKREQAIKTTSLLYQVLLNLLGRDNEDNPTEIVGEACPQADFDRSQTDAFWSAGVSCTQGILFTYFGEHTRQAEMVVELGHDYLSKAHVATPNIMVDTCLKGVSLFAVARQTGKKNYAKLAQICRSKVKRWLDGGNPNVKHYDSILDAEAMALKGKNFAAIKHYEVAILLAARNGYQHDAALASERLGEFQLSVMQDADEGSYRLREAARYWGSWGAKAKVADLEKKYGDVLQAQQPSEIYTIVSGRS